MRVGAGEGRFVRNGSYGRWICSGSEAVRSVILRLKCQVCGITYSLHPDFLVRGHHYSRWLVCTWLLEWMQGTPYRSQRFLTEHALTCPSPDPENCWSDLLDNAELRPRYQLLQRWSWRFNLQAARVLPCLLVACMATGCDLKATVAPWLHRVLPRIRPGSSCLALALGLWAGLVAGGADLGEPAAALFSLLGFLVARPLPPSHGVRRASRGAVRYDVLAHAGRDPT